MKQVSLVRSVSLGAAAVALLAGMPAHAQFGGLGSAFGALGKKNSADATTTAETCPNGKKKSVGASIMGGIAKSATSRIGGKFASFVPLPEFASILTGAIACQLDNKEQKQAADATLAVTRGDSGGDVKVGDTAEWTSSSRKDVKGKSTIVAVDPAPAPPPAGKGKAKNTQLASASQCITVSDVVIVNGEETTANKKMCRAPGQTRYALMA